MASLTQWTWVWVNSGSWWWTGRPGVLRFMGSQRIGHDWATELNWTLPSYLWFDCLALKLSKNCHNEQSTEGPTLFEEIYIYMPDCSCLNGAGFSALSPRVHIKNKRQKTTMSSLTLSHEAEILFTFSGLVLTLCAFLNVNLYET